MFKRSFASKDRVGKNVKPIKRLSFVGQSAKEKLLESLDGSQSGVSRSMPRPTSAIVTIVVGADQRLFAAHEDVLSRSPYFRQACRDLFFTNTGIKQIDLTREDPEVFSCVLEYLYKGDYSPRLLQSKSRGWYLEGSLPENAFSPPVHSKKNLSGGHPQQQQPQNSPLLHHTTHNALILRDTAIYCAAGHYALPDLQRLALRKQGLQTGIDVGSILRSMRYAYAHTPENDSRLRAHFLALVVRARRTFKKSGTMQVEMERGGAMFFDLFVALCNHLDDVSCGQNFSPRTV